MDKLNKIGILNYAKIINIGDYCRIMQTVTLQMRIAHRSKCWSLCKLNIKVYLLCIITNITYFYFSYLLNKNNVHNLIHFIYFAYNIY